MSNFRNQTRREFLKMTAAGAACTLSARYAAGDEKKRTPNIVFILADDLGWADVGYHGSDIKTPNIDMLANHGVEFDQHYVMPTCTPTRVGLMTGRYPSRYGVTAPAYGQIFDSQTVTLAQALAQTGYETYITGKWHMGSPPECTPLKYGFDHSYGYFAGQIDPYTHLYKTGIKSWHRNDDYLEEEGHATDLITEDAVRVVEKTSAGPYFLYVAYSVPHYPLDEPEKWTAMYEDIENDSRRWYAASVTHMDSCIGRIVDAVKASPDAGNTLIVFVSDNGGQKSWHSSSQYHGRYKDKPHDRLGDNRPLRGWKGDVYEGGIRVPAAAYWPGVLDKHTVEAPVHIVDWMPTLCSIANCQTTGRLGWDGRSIWPLIADQKKTIGERTLYWKTPNAQAVRQGDWKLVRIGNKSPELYNLADDPLEKTDLAKKRPDKAKKLAAFLDEIASDDRTRAQVRAADK